MPEKKKISLPGFKKRVLLAGNDGVALFAPTADGVRHEITLAWDVPDFDRLLTAALAGKNKNTSVLMLFDGIDQSYRKEENIPKLNPMDRQKYLKRKLNQAFPNFPVRAIIEIPAAKQADGTKGPLSYLFAAVPETDRIDKAAAAILESGVPVALPGFGLLPAESADLVTALAGKIFAGKEKKSRWAALIGQNETGGLRQVVVRDGMLALTRSTVAAADAGTGGEAWAEDVLREFKATLTYIARFGYTADQGLDVMVICADADKPVFAQKDFSTDNMACLNAMEALEVIGLKGESLGEGNFAGALYAAWAGKKRFLHMPVRVASIFRVMVPRLAARIGAVLLAVSFLGVVLFALGVYSEYSGLVEKTEETQTKKNLLQREYDQEAKIFDALPVKPDVVRGTLAVKKTLQMNSVNITPTLNVLRKALDNDVKLGNMSFEHSSNVVQKAGGGAASKKGGGEDRGVVRIKFDFSLIGNLPLEQKVTRAERIVEGLRQIFTGYNVKLASQFGNVSRTGKFTGSTGKEEGVQGSLVSSGAGPGEIASIEMEGPPISGEVP